MSLKTFHMIFISCSIILSVGFGYWAVVQFQHQASLGYLSTGIGAFVAAAGLVIYEILFVRKFKALK